MPSAELQMVIDMLRSSPPVPRDAAWAEQRAGLESLTVAFVLPEARQAIERIGSFLRERWA
jgi:hypothetical protein